MRNCPSTLAVWLSLCSHSDESSVRFHRQASRLFTTITMTIRPSLATTRTYSRVKLQSTSPKGLVQVTQDLRGPIWSQSLTKFTKNQAPHQSRSKRQLLSLSLATLHQNWQAASIVPKTRSRWSSKDRKPRSKVQVTRYQSSLHHRDRASLRILSIVARALRSQVVNTSSSLAFPWPSKSCKLRRKPKFSTTRRLAKECSLLDRHQQERSSRRTPLVSIRKRALQAQPSLSIRSGAWTRSSRSRTLDRLITRQLR